MNLPHVDLPLLLRNRSSANTEKPRVNDIVQYVPEMLGQRKSFKVIDVDAS